MQHALGSSGMMHVRCFTASNPPCAGHVPGAINIPLDTLSDQVKAGALSHLRSGPLALVCQSGRRSAQVSTTQSYLAFE